MRGTAATLALEASASVKENLLGHTTPNLSLPFTRASQRMGVQPLREKVDAYLFSGIK